MSTIGKHWENSQEWKDNIVSRNLERCLENYHPDNGCKYSNGRKCIECPFPGKCLFEMGTRERHRCLKITSLH